MNVVLRFLNYREWRMDTYNIILALQVEPDAARSCHTNMRRRAGPSRPPCMSL